MIQRNPHSRGLTLFGLLHGDLQTHLYSCVISDCSDLGHDCFDGIAALMEKVDDKTHRILAARGNTVEQRWRVYTGIWQKRNYVGRFEINHAWLAAYTGPRGKKCIANLSWEKLFATLSNHARKTPARLKAVAHLLSSASSRSDFRVLESGATEGQMPTAEDFRRELFQMMATAQKSGRQYIEISARELYARVGPPLRRNHRMPNCCRVMKAQLAIDYGDVIVSEP